MILSGQVSKQTLSDVFRALSQRRRNGVLAIDWQDQAVRVALQEGKIVQAHDAASNMAVNICRRLTPSGILPEKIVTLVEKSGINETQLYDLLVGKKYVTAEEFERARAGCEIDILHSLRMLEAGKIDFTSKLLRLDPRFQISVYPCQLLLDWAELEVDQERLTDLLGPAAPDCGWQRTVLRQTEKEADVLTESERLIYDLAAEGWDLKTIAEKSLLSRYDVLQAVLSLLDQQLITAAVDSFDDPILDKFDGDFTPHVFEQAVTPAPALNGRADAPKLGADAVEADAAEQSEPEDDEEFGIDDTDDQAPADMGSDGEELIEAWVEPRGSAAATADSAASDAVVADGTIEYDEEESEVEDLSPARDSLLRRIDYALLNEQVTNRLIIVTTVLYLISFAVTGADLFEQWFKALANFTSNR